jgi:uridylate kinase
VDGVLDADTNQSPHAKQKGSLTNIEVHKPNLKVMDATAISLCMDNKLPILVFNLLRDGNILRAVRGETLGTLVHEGGHDRTTR